MKKLSLISALFGAAALTAVAGPASAGTKDDIRDLQERMTRVEQSAANQGSQTVRVSEMEHQIQELTGRIEELTYQLDIANQRLDAVSAALAGDSMGADAATAGAPYSAKSGASGPVDLTATGGDDAIADQIRSAGGDNSKPDADSAGAGGQGADDIALPLNPDAAYEYASTFLLKGDYQRAKKAFELYLQAFPNHARTADAQFRLGEIYLALGENASAADAFINHIRKYPNDPRAAEAYLKLGTAFSRLDKTDEACTVFKTMKSKYPNAAAPVQQRANMEMARISCK